MPDLKNSPFSKKMKSKGQKRFKVVYKIYVIFKTSLTNQKIIVLHNSYKNFKTSLTDQKIKALHNSKSLFSQLNNPHQRQNSK